MARLTANHATWLVILALALAVRLVAGAWWQQSRVPAGEKFFFGDSLSYWVLGQAIERGEPYEYGSPDYRVFRMPGYPLLLAGLFRVFGADAPVMAGRALSAVLGTLAVGIAGWWATQLFDARAGLWAGWIAALYPGGVSMGAFVLSEAPFCPFMLLQLALWGLAWRATSTKRATALAAGAGAAGAIATLIRPSWLLFTPLALVIGLAFDNRRSRQAVMGLAICGSFVVCMLPWWIRNAEVAGHFVATTLQVGASLYDGLNPAADGGSNLAFVPEFVAAERAAGPAAAERDTFEYRLDRRMAMGRRRLGPHESAQRGAIGLDQALAALERVAQRAVAAQLGSAIGRVLHLYAAVVLGPGRGLAIHVPRLAVCAGLAAGDLFDAAARGLCQLDSLSRAGHAGSGRASG